MMPGTHSPEISFDGHLSIKGSALLYLDFNIRTSWILMASMRVIVFHLFSGSETSQYLWSQRPQSQSEALRKPGNFSMRVKGQGKLKEDLSLSLGRTRIL